MRAAAGGSRRPAPGSSGRQRESGRGSTEGAERRRSSGRGDPAADPWGGQSLAEVLGSGGGGGSSRRRSGGGGAGTSSAGNSGGGSGAASGGAGGAPARGDERPIRPARAAASTGSSDPDDRPLPGRGTGYDLSFVDYDNEWDRDDLEWDVGSDDSADSEEDVEALTREFQAFWQAALGLDGDVRGVGAPAGHSDPDVAWDPARLERLEDHVRRHDGLPTARLRAVAERCLYKVGSVAHDGELGASSGGGGGKKAGERKVTSPKFCATLVAAGSRVSEKAVKLETGECSVCIDAFKKGQLVLRLRCSHVFHEKCLAPWFRRQTRCPYCRAGVDDEAVGDGRGGERAFGD